ncbi:hypothetical protein KC19_12G081000 [Ceratodon purpureus]|uniref:Uncharacterized protein n=1 Tax=Ceratodon purpureus TaxID=3225 RepID=A0A8T0G5V9_CERPU|nr:hypothetical protein KC19_12G081000 [Ceratodon purpureus]
MEGEGRWGSGAERSREVRLSAEREREREREQARRDKRVGADCWWRSRSRTRSRWWEPACAVGQHRGRSADKEIDPPSQVWEFFLSFCSSETGDGRYGRRGERVERVGRVWRLRFRARRGEGRWCAGVM